MIVGELAVIRLLNPSGRLGYKRMIPKNAVELLQLMVSYDTVNRSASDVDCPEQKLGEKLAGIAIAMGFDVEFLPTKQEYADNVLVKYKVGEGLPWVWFDSHMDTVSVKGMTVDPFAGEIKDGKMYGRGTCDTKGTGACMLWAMHKLKESGVKKNNIALLFSVDEEEKMIGIKKFAREQYTNQGIEPVGFIVGEPTLCKPIVTHNGMMRFKLITKGIAAHSSDPTRGKSAISAMMKLIGEIEGMYIPRLDRKHELNGNAQMSINTVQGGQSANIIPDYCEAQIDRRVVPGEKTDDIAADFEKFVDEAAKRLGEIEYELVVQSSSPPMDVAIKKRLLKGIDSARKMMGFEEERIGAPFATHGGYLSETGCAVVVIGPGNIAQAHTKDEFIDLEQIECGIRLYRGIMEADFVE
ncbi:ArgE/DapE family deacylase [Planctomycetota bacterium]|nr:ArgE/DapE family deacylase [Planctomycetota bacterium]